MGKRRAPGDGGLFKRSDGLWVGSVELPVGADGKRRQKRVAAKEYKAAKKKLDDLKEKIAAGLVVLTSHSTVADWLDHWLNNIKKKKLTQSTYKFYEEAIRLHINPRIGGVKLDKLTTQHVYDVVNNASTTRNAQRAHLVLKMALGKAVDDGILPRNVCASVDKPTHTTKEQDTLTLEQARHLLYTARLLDLGGEGPLLASRWAAALWTGARPAELRGLEWNRVNLGEGLLDLSWQLKLYNKVHGCGEKTDGQYPCGRVRVGFCPQAHWDIAPGIEYRECRGSLLWTRPKTESGKRAIPIAAPLLEELQNHLDATKDDPNPYGLVWHHRDGRPLLEKQEWQLWRDLLTTAGLPQVDQYATRHTAGTMLDSLGVSETVRMAIMGHSSKVAHQSYLHADQTAARAALEKLTAHYRDDK
ncbi:tyrosine-type recombinase/integrase [Mycolicibacterium austroafricanum]|uniref:tyrosine-type recombinase/integrase n=1 Tax=Mycolicibacterium austroafricanum TaxID=39687 RepID=UPI001CA376FB|nr:site-specific integrase [Mycolicibacterium austroafricanum]QZT61297.1 site-specific integrase [Mycolicibacterium austroafricanum]